MDLEPDVVTNYEALIERAFDSRPSNAKSIGWETFVALCWCAGRNRDERWALINQKRADFKEYEDRQGLKRLRRTGS